MTAEEEISLLLSVSVSDVVPHNDHAARALAGRHARIVRRRGYAGGAALLAIAVVAVTSVVRLPNRDQGAASSRWQRSVVLDGGRLQIRPPAAGDAMTLTDQEARAIVHRGRPAEVVTVVASRWGRVTVATADGAPVPGFDNVLAWATVFRLQGEERMCPGSQTPSNTTANTGDFAETQVLVMATDGSKVVYSQAGSWLCGLPAQPVASIPESAG